MVCACHCWDTCPDIMKPITHYFTFGRAIASLLVLSPAISLPAATLLHEFTFDDPANGTTTASTGTLGGSAIFTNNSSTAVDLHGANKSGVSGKTGDYAFDNTSSTAGTTPSNIMSFDGAVFNGLTSFTVAGWFNVGSTGVHVNGGRILEAPGLTIRFRNASEVAILLQGNSELFLSKTTYTNLGMHTLDEWLFFAVTYDSEAQQFKLYTGNKTSGVLNEVITQAMTGVVSSSATKTYIGNNTAMNRALVGLMDNYRIWGPDSNQTTDTSTGALSQAVLQGIMNADIAGSNIPEPATTMAFIGAAVLLGAALLKTQRR